jgi:hypothetical protein
MGQARSLGGGFIPENGRAGVRLQRAGTIVTLPGFVAFIWKAPGARADKTKK